VPALCNFIQKDDELIQMWFKEIEDKVFTFCVYHTSEYSYMLNVILVENDKVITIRTDIFSPKRQFLISEGDLFFEQ